MLCKEAGSLRPAVAVKEAQQYVLLAAVQLGEGLLRPGACDGGGRREAGTRREDLWEWVQGSDCCSVCSNRDMLVHAAVEAGGKLSDVGKT